MLPHHNVYKFALMSQDGETHIQIGHIGIDKWRHISVPNVQSFRATYCGTDHCLAVAEVRERLVHKIKQISYGAVQSEEPN
jgi:hypothetical protein